MMSNDDTPKLGSCCVCGGSENVNTIVMLSHRAPVPGTGWGCAQCGRASNGAIAVVCEACVGRPIQFVCVGYPLNNKRIPLSFVLDTRFDHDLTKHPEMG